MITTANYFETIKNVDFSKLPDALKNGDKLTRGASQNNWSAYNSNESIKRVVDAYMQKLDEWMEKSQPKEKEEKSEPEKKETLKPKAEKKPRVKKEKSEKKKEVEPKSEPESEKTDTATPVEKLTPEIAFIKRYIGLHGKTKDQHQILNFINSLQKAILEKRIRKSSVYAKEIEHIQEQLIRCYKEMGNSVILQIEEKRLEEFSAIAYIEKTMLSVSYIKQYISIHGKSGVKARAKNLIEKIEKAVESGKIQKSDTHYSELQEVLKSLNKFIDGKSKVPEVNQSVLNGLMGIAGCGSKKKARTNPTNPKKKQTK